MATSVSGDLITSISRVYTFETSIMYWRLPCNYTSREADLFGLDKVEVFMDLLTDMKRVLYHENSV